jgi:hypothetical protein
MIQEHDAFAKALDWNALIVSVHTRVITLGKRKRIQSIGLNFVQPKAR